MMIIDRFTLYKLYYYKTRMNKLQIINNDNKYIQLISGKNFAN